MYKGNGNNNYNEISALICYPKEPLGYTTASYFKEHENDTVES